jgi:hypothetical protein
MIVKAYSIYFYSIVRYFSTLYSESYSDTDFNYLESTDGEDTRINSSESRKKKNLNEPAKQICLNVYNNLKKEKGWSYE